MSKNILERNNDKIDHARVEVGSLIPIDRSYRTN